MTAIGAYLRRSPFYVEPVVGTTPGTKDWLLHVSEEVPPEFSAILGDSIHNLRAALDLLACELECSECGTLGRLYCQIFSQGISAAAG